MAKKKKSTSRTAGRVAATSSDGQGASKRKGTPAKQAASKAVRGQRAPRRRITAKATGASSNGQGVVVGIGVAAGDIEALKQLLPTLPDDSGMAFVLVQRVDADQDALTAQRISKLTSMSVAQVKRTTSLKPNRVYLNPPDRAIRLHDRTLIAEPLRPLAGHFLPIDTFLRSLAEHRRERAIGILLSETGSDGTTGLKEIKSQGGLTIVHRAAVVDADEVLRGLLSTATVDAVMSIDQMAAALVNYAGHPYIQTAHDGEAALRETDRDRYQAIIDLLRAYTDHDLRYYKSGTLSRRIQRRMGVHHIKKVADYMRLIQHDREEVSRLFKDLLISVTSFFRDQEAWSTLEDKVIVRLVAEKKVGDTLRVWVPGCATGEEAYSLAILIYEQLERQNKNLEVQMFATDLDEDALETARQGLYPGSIVADVSHERLEKFFQPEGEHYRINKRLREASVFALQNLIGDPPFSKLDLVSCRNLLIYLEQEIQQKLIQMFHFVLNETGYLFLGTSESAGKHESLFKPVSKPWRIYHKVGGLERAAGNFPFIAMADRSEGRAQFPATNDEPPPLGSVELAKRVLLERFAPATVLINRDCEVQYFQGPVRNYLDIPTGEPTTNLKSMCLEGLRSQLLGLIRQCLQQGQRATATAPRVKRNGNMVAVRIIVEPLPHRKSSEPMLLVSFADDETLDTPTAPAPDAAKDPSSKRKRSPTKQHAGENQRSATRHVASQPEQLIDQLEHELRATREDLQSSIEEVETSNEELKASNEEVMTMNEELQSTNEELETSREELQSLNEELNTVNIQLEEKVLELENTNNDLSNLLTSSDVATIFLDTQFCIRRFTPRTTELLSVRAGDMGRPISDLAPRFNDPHLYDDARRVLRELAPLEREVRLDVDVERDNATADVAEPSPERAVVPSADGSPTRERWFLRRILPYRTSENKIDGVVVTFADVSSLKASAEQIAQRERQAAMVAQLGRAALAGASLESLFDQAVRRVSDTLDNEYCWLLQLLPGGTELLIASGVGWAKGAIGTTTVDAGLNSQPGYTMQVGGPVIVEDLSTEKRFSGPSLLREHDVVSGMSVAIGPPEAPWGTLETHTRRRMKFTVDDANFIQAVGNILSEAIRRHESEQRIRDSERQLRLVTDALPVLISYCDRNAIYRFCNAQYEQWFGLRETEVVGKHVSEVIGDDAFRKVQPYVERVLQGEHVTSEEDLSYRIGARRHVLINYVPHVLDNGEVAGYYAMVEDITERVKARYAQERLAAIVEHSHEAIIGKDLQGVVTSWNAAAEQMYGYSASEIIGQRLSLIFPDDRRDELEQIMQRIRRGEPVEHHRSVRKRKDGRLIDVILTVSPIRDRHGNVVAASTIARDISAQERAQQALGESEERLRISKEAAGLGIYDYDITTGQIEWDERVRELWGVAPDEPITYQVFYNSLHPDDRDATQAAVDRAIDPGGDGHYHAEYRVIHRIDGMPRWVSATGHVSFENGRAVRMVGAVQDITERKRAAEELLELNENLEQRIQERAALVKVLHDITSACHHASRVEEAIAYVLRVFSKYNGWCFGHAFRPADDDPNELVPFMECYEEVPGRFSRFREKTADLRLRRGEGLPGRVFASGKPEFVTDFVAEQVPTRRDEIIASEIKTAVAIPIFVGIKVVAVLEFFSDEEHDPDPRVLDAIESIGSQVGRVVERKWLQRDIAELASQEQQRIGSELHDTVMQQITGSEMMAESLRQKIAAGALPDEADIANLVQTLKQAQRQVRQLHRGLMPVEVDAAGLMSALSNLATQTREVHKIECEFSCENEVLVDNTVTATQLFRIAQEAVHNAVKHASARSVEISLSDDEEIRLAIEDDGVGFDDDWSKLAGNGMRIMRYRAEIIRGRLIVKSQAGEGTQVMCIVPRQA